MADGRLFTDYRPRCELGSEVVSGAPASSYERRQFLIARGDALLGGIRKRVFGAAVCTPCVGGGGTMLPEHQMFGCKGGRGTCAFRANDDGGLGVGRDYAVAETFDDEPRPDDEPECSMCAGK